MAIGLYSYTKPGSLVLFRASLQIFLKATIPCMYVLARLQIGIPHPVTASQHAHILHSGLGNQAWGGTVAGPEEPSENLHGKKTAILAQNV